MSATVGDTVDLANPGGKRAGIPISSATVGDTVLVKKGRYGYPIATATVGDTVLVKRVNGQLVGISTAIAPPATVCTWGIVVDSANDAVYHTNSHTNIITRSTLRGVYVTSWGGPGTGDGKFNGAEGIAISPGGNVYVVDNGNRRVQIFSSMGVYISQFYLPYWGESIAENAAGNVFVQGYSPLGGLAEYTSSGTFIRYIYPTVFPPLFGIAISSTGVIACTKFGDPGGIAIMNPTTLLPDTIYLSDYLITPFGCAFDSGGNIYVSNTYGHTIVKFTPTGTFLLEWGSYGSGKGQFKYPIGISLDSDDNVYVCDAWNNRVQKFTPTGTFLAAWR